MSEQGPIRKTKLRIENLSDLVFGLALSLGSIILVSTSVDTPDGLVTNVVLFGFSFLIVIWIWTGYTRTMSALPFEIQWTFLLNVALLFCVAIEPYLFYELFRPAPLSFVGFASAVYAVDGGSMMFILAGIGSLVIREHKGKSSDSEGFSEARFRSAVRAEIVSGSIFWASALPIFWIQDPFGYFVRFDMWYLIFVTFFIVSRFGRRRRDGSRPQTD